LQFVISEVRLFHTFGQDFFEKIKRTTNATTMKKHNKENKKRDATNLVVIWWCGVVLLVGWVRLLIV
jgi:hypothetical protein